MISFFSAKDIPGKNAFMSPSSGLLGASVDEELFVGKDSRIQFNGQPCGMIVASRMDLAHSAALKVKITYKKLKVEAVAPLVSSKVAEPTGHSSSSSENEAIVEGTRMVRGTFCIGEQFHFSMEPQTAVCSPAEDGGIDVYSASQWMDLTQIGIAQCLGLPENKVNMEVRRLGGAFGAKISRNVQIACACALACHLLQKPVRFVMNIESNMTTCGKRNACSSSYEVEVDAESGRIRKLRNEFKQDFGCSPNEGDIIHMTAAHNVANGYDKTPNWTIEGKKMYSSTPSTTWCRAPGATEGIAMIENIMEHIAFETKVDAAAVRLANISKESPLQQILSTFLEDIGEEMLRPVMTSF